jgi:cystathionine beta-synthase
MAEYGFLGTQERRIEVSAVLRAKGRKKPRLVHVGPAANLSRAIALMDAHGISQLPVLEHGVQVGSIRESNVMDLLVKKKASSSSLVREWMEPPLPTVHTDDKILNPFTVMKDRNAAIVLEGSRAVGIITVSDLVSYLAR